MVEFLGAAEFDAEVPRGRLASIVLRDAPGPGVGESRLVAQVHRLFTRTRRGCHRQKMLMAKPIIYGKLRTMETRAFSAPVGVLTDAFNVLSAAAPTTTLLF